MHYGASKNMFKLFQERREFINLTSTTNSERISIAAAFSSKGPAKDDCAILKKELELIQNIANTSFEKRENFITRLTGMRNAHMKKQKNSSNKIERKPKGNFKILHGISTLSLYKLLNVTVTAFIEECIKSEAKATVDLITLTQYSKIFDIQADILVYVAYDTHFFAHKYNSEAMKDNILKLWKKCTAEVFVHGKTYFDTNSFCQENLSELAYFEASCLDYYNGNPEFASLVDDKIVNPFAKRHPNIYKKISAEEDNTYHLAVAGAIKEIVILALFVYKHNYTHISHPHDEIEDIIKAVNLFLTYIYTMEGKNYKCNVQSLRLCFSGYSMKNLNTFNLALLTQHELYNEMPSDSIQARFRPS